MYSINEKVKNYRISYPLTQKELADKSGVSLRTIQLFEGGADIKLSNFMAILKALGLENNIDVLVPDVTQRPSYQVQQIYLKKRVRKKSDNSSAFKWGEDNN